MSTDTPETSPPSHPSRSTPAQSPAVSTPSTPAVASAALPAAPAEPGPPPTADQSLVKTALRHPVRVLIPIVILVAGAILLSFLRAPTYTAETRMGVGRIDVATQAIPGVVAGTQALASSYSRLVDAQEVLLPISEALELPQDELQLRVSGSPIAESPLFLVEATGPTEESAVDLVNLASESLEAYVGGINRTNDDSKILLTEYRQAVANAEEAKAAVARLGGGNSAEARKARGVQASTALQAEVLSDLYRQSRQGRASSNQLQIINRATTAVSDASSFRQRALFLALLAGLVIGLILAGMAARREDNLATLPAVPATETKRRLRRK